MSRTRKNFTAQFKAKLVLVVLKGEKDINTIATENNIQPNLLRNWKKEFLDNASVVFDDKREENIKETELFYFTAQDYDNFRLRLKKEKIKKKLEEIKNATPNILDFKVNINTNSNEAEVLKFLKEEILLEENKLELFKDINGEKIKNFKEEDLINFGLKLGERRKLLNYLSSIKKKVKNNIDIRITESSTVDEVCTFLKLKFNLSEEIIEEFRDNEINGDILLNDNIFDEFDLKLN